MARTNRALVAGAVMPRMADYQNTHPMNESIKRAKPVKTCVQNNPMNERASRPAKECNAAPLPTSADRNITSRVAECDDGR